MTPGQGHRECTAYLWPGPGGMPLALRLSEGLELDRIGDCFDAGSRAAVIGFAARAARDSNGT